MMKMSKCFLVSAISLSLMIVAGCAGKSTIADLMRGHATEAQEQVDLKSELAKNHETGQKLISSGEKQVKDGERRVKNAERDLKRGQDAIEKGNREIAEGQKLIQDSEQRFRENFPGLDIQLRK
jgi:septal ring factor EnvC (AmiA/AmiB activator)